MRTIVRLNDRVKKQMARVPSYIADKLDEWVEAVETDGIDEIRKIPGYHDEPLKGQRKGERSIRLSRAYRAIYEIKRDTVAVVEIKEVTKHEY